MTLPADPAHAFLEAACAPPGDSHAPVTLARAQDILAAYPDVGSASIHAAAALGNEATVRRFLAADPGAAVARSGPHGWDALTYLCFSRYLRLEPARSNGFVRAAAALLDAGASPNTGWTEANHRPDPEWESALYGAAGIAHHGPLTQLLLERGADPNDNETPYHAPEGYDNAALEVLLASGKLNADSLVTMLLRKADWHDYDGMRLVLEHGADPNGRGRWGLTALHHALRRDNVLRTIELLLDHGADPTLPADAPAGWPYPSHATAVTLAARRGRGDVLELFERRGVPLALGGLDRLLAACARGEESSARAIAAGQPALVAELRADGGDFLAAFAGVGNGGGVECLLALGIPVAAMHAGDPYWRTPPASTALHVAAWRARHDVVRLLLARGAPVDARDGDGRTPLQLAVRACVDSYWKDRRAPASVELLLAAGASVEGVPCPCGYDEVDELLRQRGATTPGGTGAPLTASTGEESAP